MRLSVNDAKKKKKKDHSQVLIILESHNYILSNETFFEKSALRQTNEMPCDWRVLMKSCGVTLFCERSCYKQSFGAVN